MEPVIVRLTEYLKEANPGNVLGVFLFGSSVMGGLRPESDIDVLVLTQRSLSVGERRDLVDFLLQFSGQRATVAPGRPLRVDLARAGRRRSVDLPACVRLPLRRVAAGSVPRPGT